MDRIVQAIFKNKVASAVVGGFLTLLIAVLVFGGRVVAAHEERISAVEINLADVRGHMAEWEQQRELLLRVDERQQIIQRDLAELRVDLRKLLERHGVR